ncbi:MAG: hypothetical protein QXN66_06805 [Thermoplasmatales archaeon]
MNQNITINIWLNEEKVERLEMNGMANMAEDRLAGMKMIRLPVTEKQKDRIMSLFPTAKYDSSTTGSIELLPRDAKERLYNLCVEMKKANEDVVEKFIIEEEKKR